MTCRHTPHGVHSPETVFSGPPTIAIATKLRSPSLTALKKAVRSAQFVGEYEAFSILHPVYILPDEASSAAPTRK